MDDMDALRRAALTPVRAIRASTGRPGTLLDGSLRRRRFGDRAAALARRAADPEERREAARIAFGAVWSAAFAPDPAAAR